MNQALEYLREDISLFSLKNETPREFSTMSRNMTTIKDMEVGVRISLLAGEAMLFYIISYHFPH